MGCAPPYCSLARLCVGLGDCFPLRVLILMHTWLLIITSEYCPKLLEIVLEICRAVLHLGKHEQKLLAYSVLVVEVATG